MGYFPTVTRTAKARGRGRNPFGSRLLGTTDQSGRAMRIRVQLLLTAMLVSTNVIGALVVVVISNFVVPSPAPSSRTLVALAIAVPVYVGVAVLVGASVGTATTLRALRWATSNREPGPDDRTRALRVPLRLTQMQALLWLGATLLFTLLALFLQPSRAKTTGATVAIAGVVVCAVAYLLTEFALRPIRGPGAHRKGAHRRRGWPPGHAAWGSAPGW